MILVQIAPWALEQCRQVQRAARKGKKMPSGSNPQLCRCKKEKGKFYYKGWQPDHYAGVEKAAGRY